MVSYRSSTNGVYRTWDEIVELTRLMQEQRGITIERMRQILLRYEGDWIIPLPEMPKEPKIPMLTPALVGELVDNQGIRASSVTPMIGCPALDGTKPTGKGSLDFANKRQGALEAAYWESMWPLAMRRMFRQLSAYSTFSVIVCRDDDAKMPRIRVRDPLSCYPEFRSFEEMRRPEYTAFVMTHSGAYLRKHFPDCCEEHGGPVPAERAGALMWDVVEWYDCEQTRFGILGPAYGTEQRPFTRTGTQQTGMALCEAIPNRLGHNPVICPEGPSLGRIAQRLAALLGSIDYASKLMALDVVAQEKATFPDAYAIGLENSVPQIDGGRWKPGIEGDINLLSGVSQVGVLRTTPDPRTGIIGDKLERNFRASTGLIAAWGGENSNALRTGRAQETLASIAIDPRIQEMHEMVQVWFPLVNESILETYKVYWPSKQYSLYSGTYGRKALTEFQPSRHVETTLSSFQYPVPGADIIQLTQILGSMAGANVISVDSERSLHPWVKDPEDEKAKILVERLNNALLSAVEIAVQQQAMPLTAVAMILKSVERQTSLVDAIEAAEKELQRLQATQAPPPQPGQVGPPESQPGLAGGPGAAMQPAPPDPNAVQVPENAQRLQQLMAAMRTPGSIQRTA
jgi:hypothetical protein